MENRYIYRIRKKVVKYIRNVYYKYSDILLCVIFNNNTYICANLNISQIFIY